MEPQVITAAPATPILVPGGGAPIVRAPGRFRRALAGLRRAPGNLASRARNTYRRTRNYFSSRRKPQGATAARKAGGRARISWGRFVLFFAVGAALAAGVGALLQRAGVTSPLAKALIPAGVGVVLIWWGGGMMASSLGAVGAGMVASAAIILIYTEVM